jgi:hypothetical protein
MAVLVDEEVLEYILRRRTYRPEFSGFPTRWEETIEIKMPRSVHRDRIRMLVDQFRHHKRDRFGICVCALARAGMHVMLQLHAQHGDGVAGCSVYLLESMGPDTVGAAPGSTPHLWGEVIDLFKVLLTLADEELVFGDPLRDPPGERNPGDAKKLEALFERLTRKAAQLLGESVV